MQYATDRRSAGVPASPTRSSRGLGRSSMALERGEIREAVASMGTAATLRLSRTGGNSGLAHGAWRSACAPTWRIGGRDAPALNARGRQLGPARGGVRSSVMCRGRTHPQAQRRTSPGARHRRRDLGPARGGGMRGHVTPGVVYRRRTVSARAASRVRIVRTRPVLPEAAASAPLSCSSRDWCGTPTPNTSLALIVPPGARPRRTAPRA